MAKAIIIDDEKRARMLLRAMLAEECPDMEVVGDAEDLPSGIKLINKHKPDLVLLDIEMPGHSGLEILDFFEPEDIGFAIVFTTAYSEFAIKAFEVNAIDYLLKPIETVALKRAVQRVFQKLGEPDIAAYKKLHRALAVPTPTRIGIPDTHGLTFVELTDIIYFDAAGAYTQVFLVENRKITTSRKLKYFEDKLADDPSFFRAHRGHLVNLKHIVKYTRNEGGNILLSNGKLLPVSREKISDLLEKLGEA